MEASPEQYDLSSIPTEILDLASVGAASLAFRMEPDPTWGQHDEAPVAMDPAADSDCPACIATQWFDATQKELARRNPKRSLTPDLPVR